MPSKRKSRAQQSTAIALSRGTVIVYAVVAFISLAGLADATYLTVQMCKILLGKQRSAVVPRTVSECSAAYTRKWLAFRSQPSVRSLTLPCLHLRLLLPLGISVPVCSWR